MTFKAIVDFALAECGYDASLSSSTPRTRFKARVNQWHRRILTRPGFSRLLRDAEKYTFASVAAQSTYGLPLAIGRLNALYELDNDRRLELKSLDWLRTNDPGLTASGTPTVYIPHGWSQVQLQPSNASIIAVKSTAAGDTQTAYLEYINAAGARATGSVSINGTTAANVVGSAIVVEITKFYLASAAAGVVTLYEDSDAGTALSTIPIGATSSRFLSVQLWPTPGAAITYYLDYTRELADLVNDTDEPLLPADFQHVLALGAVSDEWRLKDDSRYALVREDMEQELRNMNGWVWNTADYVPVPADSRPKYSRLGGWFASGT